MRWRECLATGKRKRNGSRCPCTLICFFIPRAEPAKDGQCLFSSVTLNLINSQPVFFVSSTATPLFLSITLP
jgi:hypothetical protein